MPRVELGKDRKHPFDQGNLRNEHHLVVQTGERRNPRNDWVVEKFCCFDWLSSAPQLPSQETQVWRTKRGNKRAVLSKLVLPPRSPSRDISLWHSKLNQNFFYLVHQLWASFHKNWESFSLGVEKERGKFSTLLMLRAKGIFSSTISPGGKLYACGI